jgi:hypothetical protein
MFSLLLLVIQSKLYFQELLLDQHQTNFIKEQIQDQLKLPRIDFTY